MAEKLLRLIIHIFNIIDNSLKKIDYIDEFLEL